jgi:hypothetical protein
VARLKDLKVGDRVFVSFVDNRFPTRSGVVEEIFFNFKNRTWYAKCRGADGRLWQRSIVQLQKREVDL